MPRSQAGHCERAENLERAAMDAHATGVLDKAFSFLPPEDQNALASQVLSRVERFRVLGADRLIPS